MDATTTLIAAVIVRKATSCSRTGWRQSPEYTTGKRSIKPEYLMPPARRADLTFRRLQDRSLRPCHFKPGNSAFRIVGKADPVDPIC